MDLSDDFINDFDSNDFDDPEPPEGKNRTRLIIIAAAFIIFCCCCGLLYAGWMLGDRVLEALGLL